MKLAITTALSLLFLPQMVVGKERALGAPAEGGRLPQETRDNFVDGLLGGDVNSEDNEENAPIEGGRLPQETRDNFVDGLLGGNVNSKDNEENGEGGRLPQETRDSFVDGLLGGNVNSKDGEGNGEGSRQTQDFRDKFADTVLGGDVNSKDDEENGEGSRQTQDFRDKFADTVLGGNVNSKDDEENGEGSRQTQDFRDKFADAVLGGDVNSKDNEENGEGSRQTQDFRDKFADAVLGGNVNNEDGVIAGANGGGDTYTAGAKLSRNDYENSKDEQNPSLRGGDTSGEGGRQTQDFRDKFVDGLLGGGVNNKDEEKPSVETRGGVNEEELDLAWSVWAGTYDQGCYEMYNLKDVSVTDGITEHEKIRLCYTAAKASKSQGWRFGWTNSSQWCADDSVIANGRCTDIVRERDSRFVFSSKHLKESWDTPTDYEDVVLFGQLYRNWFRI